MSQGGGTDYLSFSGFWMLCYIHRSKLIVKNETWLKEEKALVHTCVDELIFFTLGCNVPMGEEGEYGVTGRAHFPDELANVLFSDSRDRTPSGTSLGTNHPARFVLRPGASPWSPSCRRS